MRREYLQARGALDVVVRCRTSLGSLVSQWRDRVHSVSDSLLQCYLALSEIYRYEKLVDLIQTFSKQNLTAK